MEFELDFLVTAIESNNFSVGFYLLKVYEEEITRNYQRAVDALVKSFQQSSHYLKAKLHMTKMMLTLFNFNAAKELLVILQFSFNDSSVEGNLFSSSNNPLLAMCLLYELLIEIIKKFYSLNNYCKSLQSKILNMAKLYIDSVDDENFLTTVLLERDFSGRDSLKIAIDLDLLDLIQTPKVKAIIKRIYYSDYKQDGTLYEMSTTYQAVFGNKEITPDVESDFNLLKKREIESRPQSPWMYEVFKESMNSRIIGIGLISGVYVILTCACYEIVTTS
eukprot:CAMPEP_0170481100 /NCGR_PEP_ID=MMETSP0208-20121228/1674_1 /TAXON_ID=197538 /ORGANISM="Strombidium inclinatum, Strain S3" /LENGTH=275 /DNA_ID=CAMNT_0010753745 /DNA_START=950 /DNA_END=1777 /DNA_ORIENTATION=-